jgi:hypothetical protein
MNCAIVEFDCEIDDVVVRVVGTFEKRFNDQSGARNQVGVFAQVSQKVLNRREVLIFEAVGRDGTSTEGGHGPSGLIAVRVTRLTEMSNWTSSGHFI